MLNFANLMSIIQPPLRVKVRALEKANKRIVAANFRVFFNKTYIYAHEKEETSLFVMKFLITSSHLVICI